MPPLLFGRNPCTCAGIFLAASIILAQTLTARYPPGDPDPGLSPGQVLTWLPHESSKPVVSKLFMSPRIYYCL